MEYENKELDKSEIQDPHKNRYVVYTKRNTALMETFVKFDHRVRHPRMGINMAFIGVMLIALPFVLDGFGRTAFIISIFAGVFLIVLAMSRVRISVWMMKDNPQLKVDEEITYLFGNSGIRARRKEGIEDMGFYKTVYHMWEDERNYYVGLDNDDLLILPKENFEEGDSESFREFLLGKSGAKYTWKPARFGNVLKNTVAQMRKKMVGTEEVSKGKEKDKQNKK